MRYIRMAKIWAENSYCIRRQVGALIVKDKMIISDGYNGTPSGFENICEDEVTGKTKPYVLHAEANAIISAARSEALGATLYMACVEPESGALIPGSTSCSMCRRLIINAGIDRVVIRNTEREYSVVHVEDWVREDDSLPQQV